MAFIPQTKEYLSGKLRKGVTINGKEPATFIRSLRPLLPGCVEEVRIRAEGEFFCWEAVAACIDMGFGYAIAKKEGYRTF